MAHLLSALVVSPGAAAAAQPLAPSPTTYTAGARVATDVAPRRRRRRTPQEAAKTASLAIE